jgi:hypothetical protein
MTSLEHETAVERTGENGRERPLAFAMQKVEGSSPFIPL